ncbi:MAG: Cadmium, cobalt and zinc/H(+)-K(+) antiporter [Chroococcidiopsis cubana SAG 39.79]|uniref:Cation efflux protein transmembrane domain-containing protein n=1 Tax=Chroococcidiopsis cubana SAG 39.79 TaxID=388085 RepID=A0AB37USD2_9CYAN|nr:cation diffusion facilitator family transporter [Chroococcidiopsis cubana]MDZ4877919.1 Cadmium, cobalt and zinc/H(+)-K(+) antiporter [Chroococcidiopsis cubana SAG 39.79]RUT14186.1 hypothetical protein DSM107010_06690 [Chroococcidiopsis cubana SAG 39.79]
MRIVVGLSLVINGFNAWLLQDDSHHNLNLRGAFLHVVADAASSVGVMLAALAIYYLNWLWADVSASLLVACLLSLGAVPLVKDSLEILMEYAPPCIDVAEIEAILRELKPSIGIHPPESPPVLLS